MKKCSTKIMSTAQPPDWEKAFKEAARRAGINFSEWVGLACKNALPNDEQEKLSARKPRKRRRTSTEMEVARFYGS